MVKIEKGIPITPNKPSRERKYPWLELGIGDSFLITTGCVNVASMVAAAGNKYGRKFSTRKVDEGTRVWRVA